jgi:hypothetical protein
VVAVDVAVLRDDGLRAAIFDATRHPCSHLNGLRLEGRAAAKLDRYRDALRCGEGDVGLTHDTWLVERGSAQVPSGGSFRKPFPATR